MEAVERINEGWDVRGIAGIINNELNDEFSPVAKAAQQSQEPFRAAVYEFGYSSGLFNPDTLDGSEIWHDIISELDRLQSTAIEEEDVHPSEDNWPHDKPFPKNPGVSGDINNDEVTQLIGEAAKALAKDAVELAAGVWDDEGDGEGRFSTGAKTGREYVSIAAPRFLTKDVKKAVLAEFEAQFNEYVTYFLEYVNKER